MSQLFLLYSTASSDFEIDKNNNVKSASPETKTKGFSLLSIRNYEINF